MSIELIIIIIVLAFILELLDVTAGMGYGTILTPLLLLLGFKLIVAVPAVLLSNIIFGIVAAVFHHKFKNADFSPKSRDLKITLILVGFGILSLIGGIFLVIELPENILKAYIGAVVIIIGILIFVLKYLDKEFKFGWKKIAGIGFFAAFNKMLTGGGYGTVLAGGQILTGVKSKNAVGITAFSEGLISVFALIIYLIATGGAFFNIYLVLYLTAGSLAAVPLGAYIVKKIKTEKLKYLVASFSIIIGIIILIDTFFFKYIIEIF